MIDPTPLWDFADPAGSEERFRTAAASADPDDVPVLLTQVARALGLQGRYDEGHRILDGLATAEPEVAVRVALERGRLLRSADEPERALPCFEEAVDAARDAGLDPLHVDALHMVALVAPPEDQVSLGEQALAVARASADPAARAWQSSLLSNIGMSHADAGDHGSALACFEEALATVPADAVEKERVARWMVGWSLRLLGRTTEALTLQRGLKADLEAAGTSDPYVDEELALLGEGTAR